MNVHLDSDLLRTFVTIADTGNITRAADVLSRTQSAISMQIKRLEETVGEPLFERESRGVRLTGTGERLLGQARRIVALLDETIASLNAKPLGGKVRIGIPEEFSDTILPSVLGGFDKKHPGVEITVQCSYSDANNKALYDGELDLAVVFEDTLRAGSESLMNDPTVWVTSIAHCMHECDPIPVAMFERGCWCRDWAIRSLEQQRHNYRIAYTSDTSDGLLAAVTAGLAIAPLSRSKIPEGCRELTLADGFTNIDTSHVVLRHSSGPTTAAIDGMAEAIRDAFRSRMAAD